MKPYITHKEVREIFTQEELKELGISFIYDVGDIGEVMSVDVDKCPKHLLNLIIKLYD